MTAPAMTEAEWQAQVVELAHVLGWHHLHVRRSIGKGRKWTTATNVVGWPDLLLWKAGAGFVALELKVGRNKPTDEQLAVLAQLEDAGARTAVAWPDDIEQVQRMLTTTAKAHA